MIQDIVIELIREICRKTVKPDEALLSSGILDSVSVVDLLLGLESKFGVRLDLEDLEFDRLETVNCIVILVEEKMPAPQLNTTK